MARKEIRTEIIINASTAKVWTVLMENENYEIWNPFIVKSEGKIALNKRINNTVKNGKKEIIFRPVVTNLQLNKKFAWKGSLFLPGIFDGFHAFELHQINNYQTKLVHYEQFSGILSELIFQSIKTDTKAGFVNMNKALKKVAES